MQSLRGASLLLAPPCPRLPSAPRTCPIFSSNCSSKSNSNGTICCSSPVPTSMGETPSTSGRPFSHSREEKPQQEGGKPMLACISRSSSSITSPIGEGEDSSSRGRQNLLSSLGTLLFLLAPPAISLLLPGVASASGGTLSGGALDLFRQFLVSKPLSSTELGSTSAT
eukprot:1144499-Pelagomonas_calceolata.AAC.5